MITRRDILKALGLGGLCSAATIHPARVDAAATPLPMTPPVFDDLQTELQLLQTYADAVDRTGLEPPLGVCSLAFVQSPQLPASVPQELRSSVQSPSLPLLSAAFLARYEDQSHNQRLTEALRAIYRPDTGDQPLLTEDRFYASWRTLEGGVVNLTRAKTPVFLADYDEVRAWQDESRLVAWLLWQMSRSLPLTIRKVCQDGPPVSLEMPCVYASVEGYTLKVFAYQSVRLPDHNPPLQPPA